MYGWIRNARVLQRMHVRPFFQERDEHFAGLYGEDPDLRIRRGNRKSLCPNTQVLLTGEIILALSLVVSGLT
jgi:hypothetical protein